MKPQNQYYANSVYGMDEAVAPKGLGASNNGDRDNLRVGPYSNNTEIEVQPNGEVVESVLTQPLKQLEK